MEFVQEERIDTRTAWGFPVELFASVQLHPLKKISIRRNRILLLQVACNLRQIEFTRANEMDFI